MKTVLSLISESDGNLSSMRVGMFLILLSVLAPAVWYAFANNQPSIQVDWQQIGLIAAALGAKSIQRGSEHEPPTSNKVTLE